MKLTGTEYWNEPNIASNSTEFSALPGGNREFLGRFFNINISGYWWSSTEEVKNYPWYRTLYHSAEYLHKDHGGKVCGLSVRCIKE